MTTRQDDQERDYETLRAFQAREERRIGRGVLQIALEKFAHAYLAGGELHPNNVEVVEAVVNEVRVDRGPFLTEFRAVPDASAMWKRLINITKQQGRGGLRDLWPHLTMGDLVAIAEAAIAQDKEPASTES